MNIKFARRRLSDRLNFRGLQISIETDKGEKRHWYDPHEKKHGTTTMRWPYGYIRRTEGLDGDHVDCFVGPNERAPKVYIVHQMKAPHFSEQDEDKCMLGFLSSEAAKKAYLQHYTDTRFFGSMTEMSFEDFKNKVARTFSHPGKIAMDLFKPRKKPPRKDEILENLAYTGLAGAALSSPYAARYVGRALERHLTPKSLDTHNLEQSLRQQLNVPDIPIRYNASTSQMFYDPKTKIPHSVQIQTKAPMSELAHELGHASGKMLPRIHPSVPLMVGTTIGGQLAEQYLNPEHPIAKILPYALTLPGLAAVPEEIRASWRGYKAMRQLGHGRKSLLSLLPALSSYVAGAAVPGIAAELTRRQHAKYGEITMTQKHAQGEEFAELAPALAGLALGMPTGRALAGHTAAGMAPWGRKTRSEDIARRAGYVGAPLGGIAALGLSRKFDLAEHLKDLLARGVIADKDTERKAIGMLTPLAVGLGGSALGGLLTGAATGAIQRGRGPSRRGPAYNETVEQPMETMKSAFLKYARYVGTQAARQKFAALDPRLVEKMILGGLLGGGTGAAVGGLTAPEDESLSRALKGGLIGLGTGASLGPAFRKIGAGLGDPAFWQGGSEAANAPPPPPPNEEEVVMSLPTGVFQGMNTKLDPQGQKSTSVKVTPEGLGQAEALAQIFQANPAAKVEISSPETKAMGQEGPGGMAPGEGLSPTQGQVAP